MPPGLSVVRVAKLMPGPAGAAVSVPQMVRGSLVSKTRDVNVPVLEYGPRWSQATVNGVVSTFASLAAALISTVNSTAWVATSTPSTKNRTSPVSHSIR